MHIAVYGVGRSGTKAIQLYLAYLLAREHGEVWVNYEPYAWVDRKAVERNVEGFYHHSTSPQLLSNASRLRPSHRRFLRSLTRSDRPIVTKFVRANGRLAAISQILEPDWSVVIVRDLYGVLASLMKTGWPFLPGGHGRRWDDFVREVKETGIVERLGWCLDRVHCALDQDALYWYVMNLAVLQQTSVPTIVIDYETIGEIEGIARTIIRPSEDVSFRSAMFDGANIHRDHPLVSPPSHRSRAQLVNRMLARVHATERLGLFIPGTGTGGPARLSENRAARAPERPPDAGPGPERTDLYEYLSEEIRRRLARRRATPIGPPGQG